MYCHIRKCIQNKDVDVIITYRKANAKAVRQTLGIQTLGERLVSH